MRLILTREAPVLLRPSSPGLVKQKLNLTGNAKLNNTGGNLFACYIYLGF